MRASLSDRILLWLVTCPRCSFRARLNARGDQIRDHIDLLCPACRKFGLDAVQARR